MNRNSLLEKKKTPFEISLFLTSIFYSDSVLYESGHFLQSFAEVFTKNIY